MIYNLVGGNDLLNPLEQILENRKIEDIEKFLKPSIKNTISYEKLKNIQEAIKLLLKHIKSKSRIGILVDSDPDGITSAAALASYLKKIFPEIELVFYFHKGKQHGFTKDILRQIEESKPELVIAPDSASNDYEQHKFLKENNIEVLILDHHDTEKESTDALVVNVQLSPEYSNKWISGAGVVYKFLQALDVHLEVSHADDYLDIVALGNIADVMRLDNPDTRYIVYRGLQNISNPLLKELIKKNASDEKFMTPKVMSFKIIPQLNAMIRVGEQEQKMDVFRAMMGVEEEFYNTRTKKTETLPQKATRLCTNAYAKQRRVRDKWLEIIKAKIDSENLDNNAFMILNIPNFDKELSGYIASSLTGVYKKPALLMTWNEEEEAYTGSLRGYDAALRDTKTFLNSLETFEFVEGHEQAAGFKIKEEPLKELPNLINTTVKYDNEVAPTNVDFIVTEKALTGRLIDNIAQYEGLWGHGAEEPMFAVKNVSVRTSEISVGKNNLMGKFNLNGIDYIQFQLDDRLMELVGKKKTAVCDFVGKVGINGKETYQFIIEAVDVKEIKEDAGSFIFDLF